VPQKPTWWLGGFLELRVKGETRHAYPNGWKLCGHKAVQEVGLDVVVPGPWSLLKDNYSMCSDSASSRRDHGEGDSEQGTEDQELQGGVTLLSGRDEARRVEGEGVENNQCAARRPDAGSNCRLMHHEHSTFRQGESLNADYYGVTRPKSKVV
jgi:hypothetical protein